MAWIERELSFKEKTDQSVESNEHSRNRIEYERKSKLVKRLMKEAVEEYYEGSLNKEALVSAVIKLYEEGKAADLEEAKLYLAAMPRPTSYRND